MFNQKFCRGPTCSARATPDRLALPPTERARQGLGLRGCMPAPGRGLARCSQPGAWRVYCGMWVHAICCQVAGVIFHAVLAATHQLARQRALGAWGSVRVWGWGGCLRNDHTLEGGVPILGVRDAFAAAGTKRPHATCGNAMPLRPLHSSTARLRAASSALFMSSTTASSLVSRRPSEIPRKCAGATSSGPVSVK